MEHSKKNEAEIIIKSKRRVQKHGEVFTPRWMINKMLNTPGIKEACESLDKTFLEPAAGEGAFLVEILKRKLSLVKEQYSSTLIQYENYSLFVLSTIYGIELLEDNAQLCVLNLFDTYMKSYTEILTKFEGNINIKVTTSAKTIITKNIVQGNFLTRLTPSGSKIRFVEWKAQTQLSSKKKIIKVSRTDYTLDEIFEKIDKLPGESISSQDVYKQLNLFDLNNDDKKDLKELKATYVTVRIIDVYKEEIEVD